MQNNPTGLVLASDVLLAKSTRRSRYEKLELAQDKNAIARFLVERLTERFVWPVELAPQETKHGFTTMALSCLLAETLESFWCGWPDSDKKSKQAFVQFFARVGSFHEFRPHAVDFYKHVRCGILHQGETTGGWRVTRRGALFDPAGLVINATIFHRRLHREILDYANLLQSSPWDSDRWQLFRTKMAAICANSQ